MESWKKLSPDDIARLSALREWFEEGFLDEYGTGDETNVRRDGFRGVTQSQLEIKLQQLIFTLAMSFVASMPFSADPAHAALSALTIAAVIGSGRLDGRREQQE